MFLLWGDRAWHVMVARCWWVVRCWESARSGSPNGDRARWDSAAARRSSAGSTARSEEHKSGLQSLMRISYALFGLQKRPTQYPQHTDNAPPLEVTIPGTSATREKKHD